MKKTMKLMALVLALATLFALMAGCSGGEKKDVIVLGTSADYPPFESMALNSDLDAKYDEIVVANGKEPNSYYGIDIAMAKAIAKQMGKELQIVNMSFDNLITALGKGVVLIGDGTEVTEKYFRTAGVPCTAAPDPIRLQSAYGVAMAAAKAEPGTANDIHPVYLRLSQAERERLERMKKEGETA